MRRIAVWGIGAIGAAVTARLALAGHDPVAIARPAAAGEIRRHGLTLRSSTESHVTRPRVITHPEAAGPQDLLLIAVKAHAAPALMTQIAPLLDARTTVVSLVNGLPWWYFGPGEKSRAASGAAPGPFETVDPAGVQWRTIGPARALGAVLYTSAHMENAATVFEAKPGRYVFGELAGGSSPRLAALVGLFASAGYRSEASPDIRRELWLKLVGNLCTGPSAALTGADMAQLLDDPDTRRLAEQLVAEGCAVARALGLELALDPAARVEQARAQVGRHKPSMLQDVEAGRRLEIEPMAGAVAALAREAGVATPALDTVLALARRLDRGIGERAATHGSPRPAH